jgi:hypothetical protein
MVVIWKPDSTKDQGWKFLRGYCRGQLFTPVRPLQRGVVSEAEMGRVVSQVNIAAAKRFGIV